MLCFMARRYLAAGERQPALALHLASCAGCRAEERRVGQLLTLLAEPAPPMRLQSDHFTQRVMVAIQKQKSSPASFTWAALRPAAGFRLSMALPALCLMLAAGAMALLLSGQAVPVGETRLAGSSTTTLTAGDEYQDSLRPPREVPFSVEEDLVGRRRGTIPLTTYVLEPAPKDAPVVLASF